MAEPETEKVMTEETRTASGGERNKEVQQKKAASVESASDDNIISVEYIKRADGKTVKRTTKRKVVKKMVKKSTDDGSKAKNTTFEEMEPKSTESTKSAHVAEAEGVAPRQSKNEGTSEKQWSSLLAQSYQRSMPDSTLETAPKAEHRPLETMELPTPQRNEDGDGAQKNNEIQETTTNNGTFTEIMLSKGKDFNDDDEETNMSSSKGSSDGILHVAETEASKASSETCRLIIISVLFLALCAGAFLNFVAFNNPDKKSKSALSNSSGSLAAISSAPSSSTTSPTWNPTMFPSSSPTAVPTMSGAPTMSSAPSDLPSIVPSTNPTISHAPSNWPTSDPSGDPSSRPTNAPTSKPSSKPSSRPTTTSAPSNGPTTQPSNRPTISDSPSSSPSNQPSSRPTMTPSDVPTVTHSPTKSPTKTPTRFPTTSPTKAPTRFPTRAPTPIPTPSPTASPTIPLEQRYEARLRNYLENGFGVRIESNKANQAVSTIVEEAKANGFNEMTMAHKIVQRYAMINMELALIDSNFGTWGSFKQDECSWTGIVCNGNQEVTHIRLLGKGLMGTIASEIGLLKALMHLDLASNGLQGTIPEELYDCLSLQKIFLYDNRLSGTISDKIIDLWDLAEFNLSTNLISGRIPATMRSTGRGIYKIRYFNVYDNQMTGPMPAEGSRLRQMYYMDLGRNRFSGRIPPMDEYVRLRHLYLDHNQFSGQLPQNIVNTGNGRLKIIAVNDNRFTGKLPGEHTVVNELMQFTAQNNQFSSMTGRTCQLSVIHTADWGGQSSEFKSDCNICACGKNELFCKYCYN